MKTLVFASVLTGLACVGAAEAAIVHQQPASPLTAYSSKSYGVPLSQELLDGEAWSMVAFQVYSDYYYSSGDASWDSHTSLMQGSEVEIALEGAQVANLAVGTRIAGDTSFSTGSATLGAYYRWKSMSGGWSSPSYGGTFGGGTLVAGYLGLELNDGADTYYGWMRIDVTADAAQRMNIHEWAINTTPGESILVGQTVATPEPMSLAILSGGAGLMLLRRRRH